MISPDQQGAHRKDNNHNVTELHKPGNPLNELPKQGAQQLSAQAIEAEVQALLAQFASLQADGKQAVVPGCNEDISDIQFEDMVDLKSAIDEDLYVAALGEVVGAVIRYAFPG